MDIGIAIYETDQALMAHNITAFDYCFDWRKWTQEEIHYLDARLGEVRGLDYGSTDRNAEELRPKYNCYSFASLSGKEQLVKYLRENDSITGEPTASR
ncbi:hypothetical protein [Arthrobacter psychrolactophilus]